MVLQVGSRQMLLKHAMLHNMFFLHRHPKTRNHYGACWCILNNHHGHALQCAGCVAWAGDAYHVIISVCQNGLTRSWLVLLATCSSLSAKEFNLVWIWRPPTTDRWTTVTLLLSQARQLQRPSALCQAWRFPERYSWTSEALVPEFVILIQETFIMFCCWTGMNIRTINYMHVSYLQVAIPGNISFRFHKLF